jgi:hypothetical protein
MNLAARSFFYCMQIELRSKYRCEARPGFNVSQAAH